MTSIWNKNNTDRVTPWVAFAAVGLVLGGCVFGGCGTELPAGIQINGNVVPSDECLVKTQGGGQQEIRPTGVLDLAVGDAYTGFFLITNYFPQFEGITGFQPDDARVDGSTVSLAKIKVTMELPLEVVGDSIAALNAKALDLGWTQTSADGAEAFTPSGTLATTSYERAMGGTFGPQESAVAITDVIPRNLGRLLRVLNIFKDDTGAPASNEIEATLKITAHGKRADGKKVSSGTFIYPVIICYRCLMADIFPRSQALNPFTELNGVGVLTVDAVTNSACSLGTDVTITNAVCGALYGPGSATADPCKLDRCFGDDDSTGEMGDSLQCDNDGITADIGVTE